MFYFAQTQSKLFKLLFIAKSIFLLDRDNPILYFISFANTLHSSRYLSINISSIYILNTLQLLRLVRTSLQRTRSVHVQVQVQAALRLHQLTISRICIRYIV